MESAQGTPTKGGAGGIIHLDEDSTISFATSLGEASNNFIEFMAIKLLILLAKERGISHLNIYGDSMLVINCVNGTQTLHKYTLQPLMDDVKRLLTFFSHISFTHVYRNWNKEADQLSKDGLVLDQGIWKVWEKGP
jgi:ribonuclease HI